MKNPFRKEEPVESPVEEPNRKMVPFKDDWDEAVVWMKAVRKEIEGHQIHREFGLLLQNLLEIGWKPRHIERVIREELDRYHTEVYGDDGPSREADQPENDR